MCGEGSSGTFRQTHRRASSGHRADNTRSPPSQMEVLSGNRASLSLTSAFPHILNNERKVGHDMQPRSSPCGTAKMNPLRSMRRWVLPLTLLSGLRIRHCHELWYRSQMQFRSPKQKDTLKNSLFSKIQKFFKTCASCIVLVRLAAITNYHRLVT